MHVSSTLTLLLALAAPLSAQVSSGPTVAIAHALSVDSATGASGTLFFTQSDFSSTAPGTWSPQTGLMIPLPDFGALFSGLNIDIDAISVGLDWILADPSGNGEVTFPLNGSWGALSFSVTPSTTTATGAIGAEIAGNGAAGDVFAYVLPGSNVPASIVDVTFRAQDSTEIDIGPSGNIDAHDIYMSFIYGENPQIVEQLQFPPIFPPTVYFSVTSTTANAMPPVVPPAWWGGTPPSGATILATTWDPVNLVWMQPAPFLQPIQLGLNGGDEVDALAFDFQRGFVLFSTTNPNLDPLLFHDVNGPPGNSPYRLQMGHPAGNPLNISDRIGIGVGNLDAICTLDPGTLGGARYLQTTMGTPHSHDPNLPPLPRNLGVSVFRRRDRSTSNEQLLTWMTGVPGPPGSPPGAAIIALTLTGLIPAGAPGPPAAGYLTGNVYIRPRPGYAGFAGLPQCHVITIPGSLNLTGAELFFVWGAVNTTGFTVTFPTGITL